MNALIIHGWDGSPKEPLHQYLTQELESRGYEVQIPEMPNPEVPVIKEWLDALEALHADTFDLIIGHSIGCQAVLRFLAQHDLERPVKIVLIAPWMELDRNTIEEEGEEVIEIAKPWMETPIDFKKVTHNTSDIVAVFSDDDPYVSMTQPEVFKETVGAKVFIEHNQGHFTESDNFKALETDINLLFD